MQPFSVISGSPRSSLRAGGPIAPQGARRSPARSCRASHSGVARLACSPNCMRRLWTACSSVTVDSSQLMACARSSVALEELIGRGWPRAGGVEVQRTRWARGVEDRLQDLPGALDLVGAREEAGVADHRVDQQVSYASGESTANDEP